jgi:hypothetical protein
VAGTGRGQSGRSGELVNALLCKKIRGKGPGLLVTVACRTATVGAEREAKERARVDGDPGGAPADGEGAPGGVKDVNLQ